MITTEQYTQAKQLIKDYEIQQGLLQPVYECICRQNGLKSWQTGDCPHSEEQHNDRLICTRKIRLQPYND